MLADNNFKDKLIRSFGRTKSRKLSDHKQSLLSELLPKYQFEQSDLNLLIKNFNEIHLEIGFGFGDFLYETAKNNPEIGFVGCEPHINGVVNLLAKLEQEPLKNIKILNSDSRPFLEEIPNNIFQKIYILFPDPWPKLKHYKRRLINVKFLELLHQKMSEGSELIIASDHDSYKEWIMIEILKSHLFNWSAKSKFDWQNFPANWIQTKYQKKAAIEGRASVYLEFIKA